MPCGRWPVRDRSTAPDSRDETAGAAGWAGRRRRGCRAAWAQLGVGAGQIS